MNCNDRCSFNACGCFGVLLSIIVGAIVGILFVFCLIPFIVITLWIVFGLGVLTLIFIFIALLYSTCCRNRDLVKCTKRNVTCLLAGTIGTIIASIIGLSIALPVNILVSAIIAIVAFFFTLMIVGLIAYISCIVCELPES